MPLCSWYSHLCPIHSTCSKLLKSTGTHSQSHTSAGEGIHFYTNAHAHKPKYLYACLSVCLHNICLHVHRHAHGHAHNHYTLHRHASCRNMCSAGAVPSYAGYMLGVQSRVGHNALLNSAVMAHLTSGTCPTSSRASTVHLCLSIYLTSHSCTNGVPRQLRHSLAPLPHTSQCS